MEYLSHFGDAYLFFFVPRFSFSHKVQIVNLKKVYAIDNGMIEANSISFSNDNGRLLENMVYMQLRRKTKEIYYFAEKKECDFIVYKGGKLSGLYQVCWQLDQENLDREIAGLIEALVFFKCNSGVIITHDQSDVFIKDGKTITAIPFYKWALTESYTPSDNQNRT
jgi:predicted AAA+ superfamily ATPase